MSSANITQIVIIAIVGACMVCALALFVFGAIKSR